MFKKILALSFIASVCFACGNNAGSTTEENKAPETKTADITKNPDYQKGLALISKNDCLTCHKVDETLTGPPYRDVANKYNNDDTTITKLANKIIKGGSGNWGQVPMTPHPSLSEDDAKALVRYVLLLKNK